MHPTHPRSAFTLIELLVVIAIIAILAVVVVLTLNPAELLRQSRDANRLSDLSTMNDAVNLYATNLSGTIGYSLGTASTSEISVADPTAPLIGNQCQGLGMPALPTGYTYDCSASSTVRNINNTGWIPINFTNISAGTPFSSLPVDPVNTTSSNLYYTYQINGSTYAISASLESTRYAKAGETDGSSDPTLIEAGSGISSLPDLGRGLVGYWPLNEGTGTTVYDWSGNGSNGIFFNSPTWTQGHVWSSAVQALGTGSSGISLLTPSTALPTSSITVALWENTNTSTFQNYAYYISNNWLGAPGSWVMYSNAGGQLNWGIASPASTTSVLASCASGNAVLNTWQFIVGTYDGTTMRTYVNGTQCGTASLSSQALWTGSHLTLGPGYNGDSVIINDIRIYDYALPASEIQAMYNAEK